MSTDYFEVLEGTTSSSTENVEETQMMETVAGENIRLRSENDMIKVRWDNLGNKMYEFSWLNSSRTGLCFLLLLSLGSYFILCYLFFYLQI